MAVKISKDDWALLGNIYGAISELSQKLEDKGFKVISSLSVGIHKGAITFIVQRNHTDVLSFVTFDAIKEQEKVAHGLFDKAELLLNTDPVMSERAALLKRLTELESEKDNG